MLATRLFLGFNVLTWLPYGVFCFFQPGYLNEAAGLMTNNATAATEVRAMYGGLQAAIGSFALAALFRPDWVRPLLLTLVFVASGLALGRLGGILVDGDVSRYTAGAIGLEILLAGSARLLLGRHSAHPATP